MTSEVTSFYDEFSARLVRDYVHGNKRVDAQIAFLRDAIGPETERIVVIGCGSGEVAHYVAGHIAKRARILAVDISPTNIRIAQLLFPHRRIEYRCADALNTPIQGSWDVIVLPDVYEHIPLEVREKLHANLKPMLSTRGRVLLTLPSPGHQAMLRERGEGLQIVDETVTLNDLTTMADDLGATLTYFAMVTVFNTSDYVHAVIERGADRLRSITQADRLALKRLGARPGPLRRRWLVRSGRLRRAWRRRRVARLLASLQAQDVEADGLGPKSPGGEA